MMFGYIPRGSDVAISICMASIVKQDVFNFCMVLCSGTLDLSTVALLGF